MAKKLQKETKEINSKNGDLCSQAAAVRRREETRFI
jgi:hypothetical protein